jgi:hypothetical protein
MYDPGMQSNTRCAISTSSSYSSNDNTLFNSPSAAGTGGGDSITGDHHNISEPYFGISLLYEGYPTETTTSHNPNAYIHPGYAFSDFIDCPASPNTLGNEHKLDDIAGGTPPPSSSPTVYEEPCPCDHKFEETALHFSIHGPSGTPRAETKSANVSGHQQSKPRPLVQPLDLLSHVIDFQITDEAVSCDDQANAAKFIQFACLGSPSPSAGVQLEKKSVTASSMPLLASLAHHRSMFSERCSISHHIKAHPSKRLRTSKTLKTVKSLSKTKSTECDPSQGHFKRRRILPLEHLRDSVEQKPQTKKARIDRPGSHRSDLLKIRTSFSAKGPASLRKAQSLVSQTSTDRDDEAVVKVRSNDLLSKGPWILLWMRLTMRDENSFWTPQTLR